MRDNVYAEYKTPSTPRIATGVRATCSDCHVPKDLTAIIIRKMQASNELLHKQASAASTPRRSSTPNPTPARKRMGPDERATI